ncbi:MAG: AAA family ATPase [Alphaproteobacteria bacterium]|nr:AAA family ATPase [Alphaproteobacteria bacterium]
MSENFEKQKILSYVLNVLNNQVYVRQNLKNTCEWLDEKCDNYFDCPCKIKPDKVGKDDMDFNLADYAKRHKKDARLLVKKFAEDLAKTALAVRHYKIGHLERNLLYLQQLFALKDEEKEFLGFVIREKCDSLFRSILYDFKSHGDMTIYDRAVFLNIKPDTLFKMCKQDCALNRLGLMETDYDGDVDISRLTKRFYFQKFDSIDDIRSFLVGTPCAPALQWQDFKHIEQIDVVKNIMQAAKTKKTKGINILLYGEPGTGKTEFAKTLTAEVAASLYAVGENPFTVVEEEADTNRFAQLLRTQMILQKDKDVVLLLDEADDVLEEDDYFFGCKKNKSATKIRVNRLLETNRQPIIWIVNNIRRVDKAYLRRFTYALNFTRPKKTVREEMWQKSLQANNLPADAATAKKFAAKYSLSPAFIASAVKSVKLIGGGLSEVEQTLDVLQQVYNNGHKVKEERKLQKIAFNPELLNTDVNLTTFADKITALGKMNFSLCLYGASGTGKSAFAQYLGEQLNLPVLKKKCSDLIGPYVGETEHRIAEAFEEAKERGALLIFDEADSFLQDRNGAFRNWEVTQVNEMLTQMEQHQYPFVCTTNLMDKLDKASLRRFTFKVKYDYLTPNQRSRCFEHFFNFQNVDLSHLATLTPGDFVVVHDKAEIIGCLSDKDELIKMLEQEQQNKMPVEHHIGFI